MRTIITKKSLALVIVLALLLLAAGCGEKMVGGPTEVSFQRVQEEELPEEVQSWLSENIMEYGEKTFVLEDKLYILVAYGEKPTAGYSVEIDKVEKLDGKVVVYSSFQDPDPDDLVATVITYPYDLIVIEDQGLPVTFKISGTKLYL
jgi:hypothetical protein